MTSLENQVESLSKKVHMDLIEVYRRIHQDPELSWQEEKTSGLIAHNLEALGLKVQKKVAKTGVVGILEGKEGGKTLAIRADMDALPIDEELTGLSYASRNKGIMHACGHDAHVAIVLGTAMVLSYLRDHFYGKVKFIFQPSEEMQPSGASTMVEEGVLKNPDVDAIIFGHSDPSIDVGKIGLKSGPMMAASDFFQIIIEGEGGHAAYPHLSKDTMVSAACVIQQLHTIVSRRISPLDSAVITIATINGGSNYCTIAHKIELTGTVRTFSKDLRQKIPKIMEETISGITKSLGTGYSFKYRRDVPSTLNDPAITNSFLETSGKVIGNKNVITNVEPQMGAEDFAFFLDKIPGIMFMIGTRNEKEGITYPLHHPRFCIDEEALCTGAKVMTNFALGFCK